MSVLSIDAIEQGLVDAGVPRSVARARALAEHGQSSEKTTAELEAAAAREEKRIVADADKQLRALGFRVINTSQPRHAKFLTPGIPDRLYFHRRRGVAVWWEAKTADGVQSPAQKDFQEDCEAGGLTYLLGTDEVLFAWLVARGIAFEEGGLLVPLPFTPATRSYMTRTAAPVLTIVRMHCHATEPNPKRRHAAPGARCGRFLGYVPGPVRFADVAATAPHSPDGQIWVRCPRSDCHAWNTFELIPPTDAAAE